jgi:hypothetical protein
MRDKRWQATLGNPKCANPAPHPNALEQQPESQPEEGGEQYGEVFGPRQVARRVLVADHHFVCEGEVLMRLVRGDRMSGAKVQNSKDSMAQKERAHEQERE